MKVIICGAGQVGFHIAKYLAAENNDVTVIDQSEELVRKISDTLEVKGIIGFGSHPRPICNRNGPACLVAKNFRLML